MKLNMESMEMDVDGTTAMDLATMRRSADTACRLMKALSNPDRLLLLCQLTEGEKRVGELEALVGIGQPTLRPTSCRWSQSGSHPRRWGLW